MIKEVQINMPTVFTYGILNPKENKLHEYIILADLGDTINLSLNSNVFLNLNLCKARQIISDGLSNFYSNDVVILKKAGDNLYFNKNFKLSYQQEIKRLDSLKNHNYLDIVSYNRLLTYCNIYYYKTTLSSSYSKIPAAGTIKILPAIEKQLPEIYKIFQNESIVLSNDLYFLIEGMVDIENIKERKDYRDINNSYFTGFKLHLGNYKLPFLTSILSLAHMRKDQRFNLIYNDFRKQAKNTSYLKYIDSLIENDIVGKKFITSDSLKTLNNITTSWDNIFAQNTKLIIIDLWASWCQPCRKQFPYIDSLKHLLKEEPIEFFSINIDEEIDDWRIASIALKKYLQNNYYLLNAKNSLLTQKFKIHSIPRIILLKDGKVISDDFYLPSDVNFAKGIRKLLKN